MLVLQHRDELVSQNSIKFNNVNPSISTSVVDGTTKDFTGNVVFSMVQTLSRDNNLNKMMLIITLIQINFQYYPASFLIIIPL